MTQETVYAVREACESAITKATKAADKCDSKSAEARNRQDRCRPDGVHRDAAG